MSFPSSPSNGDTHTEDVRAWAYSSSVGAWQRQVHTFPPREVLAPVTVTVTTAGTAHVAGTAVEVTASTAAASNWLSVYLLSGNAANGVDTSTLIEVVTGASLNTVIATFSAGFRTGTASRPMLIGHLPCPIASGTRVGVIARSTRTAQAVTVAVGTGLTAAPIKAPVAWGVDTATSHGLAIATPAGTGTPGAWTELVSSTSAAMQAIHLSPQLGASTNTANGTADLEIGVGGSGSETTVLTSRWALSSAEELGALSPLLLPLVQPAGVRISARYTRSSTAAIDLIAHGIPL